MTSRNPNENSNRIIRSFGAQQTPASPQPEEKKSEERKPEDYILEANQKAQGRTAFVGRIAERLFYEEWKNLCADGLETVSKEVVSSTMDLCIATAEVWRLKINAYQQEQAEAVHNAAVKRAEGFKLHLPTWGEIKDHFPGAHTMFGGGT
jgi:hypothetical protein